MLNKAFLVKQIQVSTNRMIVCEWNFFLYLNSDGRAYYTGVIPTPNPRVSTSSPIAWVGNRFYTFVGGCGAAATGLNYSDGVAYSWGDNWWGQLGNNTRTGASSPVSAVGGHSFVKIFGSVANGNYFALKADGSLWSWGRNSSGQLGDNTVVSRSSPVSVYGNHSFISIAPGSDHVVALKANGEVWAWGYNGWGQLGLGDISDRSTPVKINTHLFTKIAAGNAHTIALKSDGTSWGWGYNGSGQIGDNTKTNRSAPVSTVGAKVFLDISCSYNTTNAITNSDGRLWSWGSNEYGQLGNNSATTGADKSSPISCVYNGSFVSLSAGYYNCYALKANGEVWSWGRNDYGELGDGARTSRSSPVSMLGFPR